MNANSRYFPLIQLVLLKHVYAKEYMQNSKNLTLKPVKHLIALVIDGYVGHGSCRRMLSSAGLFSVLIFCPKSFFY